MQIKTRKLRFQNRKTAPGKILIKVLNRRSEIMDEWLRYQV
jgi:hypothetical protein